VIVELKRPGIEIGAEQKGQTWNYVKELREKGQLPLHAKIQCFVLGSLIHSQEVDSDKKGDNVRITPLLYETFLLRAERRMLNLYERLKEAPFLKEHGIDTTAYLKPLEKPAQPMMNFGETKRRPLARTKV
jgi:hypothetical protein